MNNNKIKTCFVIMPISVPETLHVSYGNDSEHFLHAFDYLFTPALIETGFKAISPVAEGSDIIHSEIIKNLETSDLVLCDISNLNPNVFFELGIRTALNKPVCLIKDNITQIIPFDTHLINCHTYNSSLAAWDAPNEIRKLSSHIESTSTDMNALWKVFGFTDTGAMNEIHGTNEQLKYKDTIIENLELKLRNSEKKRSNFVKPKHYSLQICSQCGHAYETPESSGTTLYAQYAQPYTSILGSVDVYGRTQSTFGYKCPACGNINSI